VVEEHNYSGSWQEDKQNVVLRMKEWGAWVAQSVKHPTLDFGSGHELRVVSSSPAWGSTLGMELA